MKKTAEAVSLGHPDKTSDYISSYILDKLIEQDPHVKYALEVLIKDNHIVLGGEVMGNVSLNKVNEYVLGALADIGYTNEYAHYWKHFAIEPEKVKVENFIGYQSRDINKGVEQNGWGDQGVFVGYACKGDGNTLGEKPKHIIVNGTGVYTYHSSIADCGITGRKLSVDFYSTACPIGGGSPWTKDASKADLTLNIYARKLALQYLKDNDECFVYLSSCIGKSELPSATVKVIKNGMATMKNIVVNKTPSEIINELGLRKPVFKDLCKNGLFSLL